PCKFFGLVSRFLINFSALSLLLLSLSRIYPNGYFIIILLIFVDILMDGPPAQSLGVEPVDHDVMRKPPRPKNKPILSRMLVIRVLTAAAIVVLGTMFIYVSEMRDNVVTARDTTMVGIELCLRMVIIFRRHNGYNIDIRYSLVHRLSRPL